jgi:ATP-dependent Clp protease ATP-binding subunit ClpA
MFERFTAQAKNAVQLARSQAIAGHVGQIGCEHLLIGLADDRSGLAATVLAEAGLGPERLRELASRHGHDEPLDADARALVGIDLDQVRRAAEAAFGPGALDHPPHRAASAKARVRMAEESRQALDLASRTVRDTHSQALSAGHLLVGIIDQGDNAALRLLTAADVDPAALREDVLRRMAAAA